MCSVLRLKRKRVAPSLGCQAEQYQGDAWLILLVLEAFISIAIFALRRSFAVTSCRFVSPTSCAMTRIDHSPIAVNPFFLDFTE